MRIFLAVYTDSIYDIAHHTVSIHKTREGARKSLATFIRAERLNWRLLFGDASDMLWQRNRSWGIVEKELWD